MGIVHTIYSNVLPLQFRIWFRHRLNAFHTWIAKIKDRRNRDKMGSRKRRRKQRATIRQILLRRPLRVAFQVAHIGKWKCESLWKLMQQDPHFIPFIWIVPAGGDISCTSPAMHAMEAKRIVDHFSPKKARIVQYQDVEHFPNEESPDIVFIHEGYDRIFRSSSYKGIRDKIICYVPYCFRNTTSGIEHNSIGANLALFSFCENKAVCKDATALAANKGRNLIITGLPIADIFMAQETRILPVWKEYKKGIKKVIWAPHWTINPNAGWFVCGTFIKTAQTLLKLARKHAHEIQFAFKPHPNLYHALCQHPDWGKEKTDAFYQQWAEMPNTQLAEGDYTALFMQSDAIIHDSGSFILEYLFADKPGLFLRDGTGYGDYNEMTIKALECYHEGITEEDIENFLQDCVLGGQDPLRERRAAVRQEYILPPGNRSCAENIIRTLLEC